MIIRRGTLGSDCKHHLPRRTCATCRQQLRDRLFPRLPKAKRAGQTLGELTKRRPDIPAGRPGNGKRS
jgi:hypothetical protein